MQILCSGNQGEDMPKFDTGIFVCGDGGLSVIADEFGDLWQVDANSGTMRRVRSLEPALDGLKLKKRARKK